MNRIELGYSGLARRRLGVIQSLVLEEDLALRWPTRNWIVPVWFWRRVDDSTAHVYGVKVKIHKQQRGDKLDIKSRQSRADASRSP
jgi:hypothetical protein